MEKASKNIYSRIIVVITIIFLGLLILVSFFKSEPKYTINSGIIVLVLIITILVLSEGFDNFSIGKLFSIEREIKNKEKEVKDIKTENEILRKDLLQFTSTITEINAKNSSNNSVYVNTGNSSEAKTVNKNKQL